MPDGRTTRQNNTAGVVGDDRPRQVTPSSQSPQKTSVLSLATLTTPPPRPTLVSAAGLVGFTTPTSAGKGMRSPLSAASARRGGGGSEGMPSPSGYDYECNFAQMNAEADLVRSLMDAEEEEAGKRIQQAEARSKQGRARKDTHSQTPKKSLTPVPGTVEEVDDSASSVGAKEGGMAVAEAHAVSASSASAAAAGSVSPVESAALSTASEASTLVRDVPAEVRRGGSAAEATSPKAGGRTSIVSHGTRGVRSGIPDSSAAGSVISRPTTEAGGRRKWTDAEDAALKAAVGKVGEGRWCLVAQCEGLRERTQMQVKDRWRVLLKHGIVTSSGEKAGNNGRPKKKKK